MFVCWFLIDKENKKDAFTLKYVNYGLVDFSACQISDRSAPLFFLNDDMCPWCLVTRSKKVGKKFFVDHTYSTTTFKNML